MIKPSKIGPFQIANQTQLSISRLFPILVVCLTLVVIATCGKDSPTKPQAPDPTPPTPLPPTPVATRVEISPSSVTLNSVGQTAPLTARVFDQNNAVLIGAAVVWSSNLPGVATVSGQGLVTAVSNGRAQITARSGNASASVTVTVSQSATRIVIEPSASSLMALGETVQLEALVLDQNGQPVAGAEVTWSSSDAGVATVSGQGLVTAVGNGSVTITARSGSTSESVPVTVMQSAGSVVIEPSTATLMSLGETVQLTAVVLDGNGQPVAGAEVDWTSSDMAVAAVSGEGLVTAVGNGSITITARSGSASASVPVTVMQSAGSVVVEPTTATLMSLGETVQLTATVLDGNGQPVAGAEVTWSSSHESVATVSGEGLVTAVGNGSVTITARSGSASASVPVTVMQSAGSVVIEPSSATLMSLGETVQLTATVLDQNGQPVARAEVTWSSSDAGVATVSGQGLVTAVGNGSVTITARSGSASASVPVTVMQSAESVVIEPSSATLMSLGETVQLEASVLDQNGQPVAGAEVSWSSSDMAIATVSGEGLVTAAGNGSVTITARSGSASASVPVSVMQSAESVVVEPSSTTLMAIGETVQLTASVLDGNGQPMKDATVSWSSNDEAVATVSAQGLVTAVSNGSAQITARSGNASVSVSVTVIQSVGSVVIEPSSATLMSLGETVQLNASVLDQNGQPVSGAVVSWQTSDEGIATVSSQGLVTAVSNGTATITARSGSVSSSAMVTVMDNTRDREALIALYNSTSGPNWTESTNWLSDEPLGTWHGVSTDAEGRVTWLDLIENRLSGPIPYEITQLKYLQGLNLSGNQLTGSVPPGIGDLHNLRLLRSSNNRLIGSIPQALGQLRNLTDLNLGGNQLTGSILPELAQLQNLSSLVLHRNQLTGSIPAELGRLENLVNLQLSDNLLTGTVPPELGQLENLRYLAFVRNPGLTGPLPVTFLNLKLEIFEIIDTGVCVPNTAAFHEWVGSISDSGIAGFCSDSEWDALVTLYNRTGGPNWVRSENWTSLAPLNEWHGVTTDAEGKVVKLDLEDNDLNGSLPGSLSDLTRLKTLNLSFNRALTGPLPATLTSLDLEVLQLEGTNLCTPPIDEFRSWRSGIPRRNGASYCNESRRDFYTLAALYDSANGPDWTNRTNWLSGAPLRSWYGVSTNAQGRVTEVDLALNNLNGSIPPEIGKLDALKSLNLYGNQLSGEIPAELGELRNLTNLELRFNQFSGTIPPELGKLRGLTRLQLWGNQLTGEIPAELGQLRNLVNVSLGSNLNGSIPPEIGKLDALKSLNLYGNQLSGEIPAELGELRNLTDLELRFNQFSGTIPPELGKLRGLTRLQLWGNQLTGEIPAELGQLRNLVNVSLGSNQLTGEIPVELGRLHKLEELYIESNQLTGEIPAEFGQLNELTRLYLDQNQLTGNIPAEIGQLDELTELYLGHNQLMGDIPAEIGQLHRLTELFLSFNNLTGNVPRALGRLANLRSLRLTGNVEMAGTLPPELIRLDLDDFLLGGTQLCAPSDAGFREWLQTIPNSRSGECQIPSAGLTVYLTQATQSLTNPVPLVAGEDALLRVFVVSEEEVDAAIPPVRATLFQEGIAVHTVDMPSPGTEIPIQLDEGEIASSVNALVPGAFIEPGLEMVIEIGSDGVSDPGLGIPDRLPPNGRMPVEVTDVPPFDLTLVPFLWTESPDRSVLTETEHLSSESDLFRLTRDILPIREFHLSLHEPVWTSVEPTFENGALILNETGAIHAMEGASGHYMGIIRGGGVAWRPGFVSVSDLVGEVIAHELGHNMNLAHALCGNPTIDLDLDFPYPDGSIGTWGYDILNGKLVSPDTADLMSYCHPQWISDYNFARALRYRVSQEQASLAAAFAPSARGLLLWGGVGEDGELVLEPAFAVDAPAVSPRLNGPYRIVGEDEGGGAVFSLRFGMAQIDHIEGGSFAFVIPIRPDWPGRLTRITLSGPEGVATLGDEDDRSAALLLDPADGKVRGILRDWLEPDESLQNARRVLPEPGLRVLISRGLPTSADW